jgi:mannose-6-phosphate isomerase-like protein (cupin superfamily)
MLPPQFVKKEWGWELWFANVKEDDKNYCGKILYVEHNKWSSNMKFHYHKIKDETFFILEGVLHIDYIDSNDQFKSITLLPNQTFRVTPNIKHRFTSYTVTGCKFIEVSTFHSDEDSYRCYKNNMTGEWIDA